MLSKILIKRRFNKGNTREIVALLNEIRYKAMEQPGYISGITLSSREDPQSMLVIGTWQNMEDWLNWKDNQTRKDLESMLAIYSAAPTHYEEYVVGTSFQQS
ncbi:MAG: antibiotic biosynthesis monooxygenase family protein [Thermodesulfobacteriota bacterium]